MIAKKTRMTRNKVRCGSCLAVLESTVVGDQKICYCGDIALDGGLEYQHVVRSQGAVYQDLSEYASDS